MISSSVNDNADVNASTPAATAIGVPAVCNNVTAVTATNVGAAGVKGSGEKQICV